MIPSYVLRQSESPFGFHLQALDDRLSASLMTQRPMYHSPSRHYQYISLLCAIIRTLFHCKISVYPLPMHMVLPFASFWFYLFLRVVNTPHHGTVRGATQGIISPKVRGFQHEIYGRTYSTRTRSHNLVVGPVRPFETTTSLLRHSILQKKTRITSSAKPFQHL